MILQKIINIIQSRFLRTKKELGRRGSGQQVEDIVIGSKNREIYLREHGWKIELTSKNITKFFGRHKGYFALVLASVFLIFGAFGYFLIVRADVTDFYPTSCLGGWQNPQNAEGKPNIGEGGLAEEFNENNSAVLRNVISQIFCGNFEGEIPKDSLPKKAVVSLSWLVTLETGDKQQETGDMQQATSTLIQVIEANNVSTSSEIVPEENNSTTPESPFPEPPSPELPLPETNTTSSPPVSFWHPVRNFISNWAGKIINFAFAEEAPEPVTATTTAEELLSTTTPETATSTTEPVISTPAAPEPFLEALYTLDGVDWQSLGQINLDNWQSIEFEIPNFNWDDVSKVQIAIQSLSPIGFVPTVYLDGVGLKVEYENVGGLITLQNPPISPGTQKTRTAIAFERTSSSTGASSPTSINVSVAYPDDLIYDGKEGSVGLTLEPLLEMRWWGIVVDTETESFVSECVSTTLPLPTAIFNLGAGDYKTGISLAETKADCETFNQNAYPLFAVIEAANFTIR